MTNSLVKVVRPDQQIKQGKDYFIAIGKTNYCLVHVVEIIAGYWFRVKQVNGRVLPKLRHSEDFWELKQ